jgi:hypothetical protein
MAFFSQKFIGAWTIAVLRSSVPHAMFGWYYVEIWASGSELWSRDVRVLSRGVVGRNVLVSWTMHQSNIMEASER